MSLVCIALGANLGDAEHHVLQAMDHLAKLAAGPVARSSLWQSMPVDCPPDSPPFVNAAVTFTALPGETPETLLPKLQAIEREFGRQPKVVHNAPRPLDLDLITFGNERRSTPELTLPHPRAHERRFVLQPIAEIAPDLVLPDQTLSVVQLLAKLPLYEPMKRLR